MQELEVPCVTVDDILKEHRVRQNSEWVGMTSDMVILSVDAEGFDPYILQSVDFDRLRPKLIVFEHQHLIPKNWNRHGRIQELRDVLAMLARHRYFCARAQARRPSPRCRPGMPRVRGCVRPCVRNTAATELRGAARRSAGRVCVRRGPVAQLRTRRAVPRPDVGLAFQGPEASKRASSAAQHSSDSNVLPMRLCGDRIA